MKILKRVFLISVIILLICLLFWGVYYLSFDEKAKTAVKEEEKPADSIPPLPTQIISAVTKEAAISPTLSADGTKIKYFAKDTGRGWEINLDGSGKVPLSSKDMPQMSGALWSPDKNKVIARFPETNGVFRFSLYDYGSGQEASLKKNLDEVSWQNDSNKIFYKYWDEGKKERTLNVASPDGTDWKKLADLSYRNITIATVPKTGLVSFWPTADGMAATTFETVPVVAGERKMIHKDTYGADFLWDNSGNNVLMSQVDQKGGNKMDLAVMNYMGGEFRKLGIPTTVKKCAWSGNNKSFYYALPTSIPDNVLMPNDWQDKKFTTADTFWKMDIMTGEKKRLVEPEKIKEKYDASELFLNADESMLFFINRIDGALYKIDI